MTDARASFVDEPLAQASPEFSLPAAAARHVQVLRLQPGSPVLLFDGTGWQWQAEVLAMHGRNEVQVRLLERERPGARAGRGRDPGRGDARQ